MESKEIFRTDSLQSVPVMPSLGALWKGIKRAYRTWQLDRAVAEARRDHRAGKLTSASTPEEVDALFDSL